jgi:hypothetical protein
MHRGQLLFGKAPEEWAVPVVPEAHEPMTVGAEQAVFLGMRTDHFHESDRATGNPLSPVGMAVVVEMVDFKHSPVIQSAANASSAECGDDLGPDSCGIPINVHAPILAAVSPGDLR